MLTFNKRNVTLFIIQNLSQNYSRFVSEIVAEAVYPLLEKSSEYKIRTNFSHHFPSKKLKNKFNRRDITPVMFNPDMMLLDDLDHLAQWISNSLKNKPIKNRDSLISICKQRINQFKTFKDIFQEISRGIPFLRKTDIDQSNKSRVKPKAEQNGHIEFIADLNDHDYLTEEERSDCEDKDQQLMLLRIKTTHGMKIAAEKAENCLYSNIYPSEKMPHKKLVIRQQEFHYYQVWNEDNECLATIRLSFGYNRCEIRGNGIAFDLPSNNVSDELYDKIKTYLLRKYPQFDQQRLYQQFSSPSP